MSSSRKHNLKVCLNLSVHLSCLLLTCAFITTFCCKETDYNSVLQSLMLSIAKGLLEAEKKEREEERKRYMAEMCPSLSMPSGVQALQVLIYSKYTQQGFRHL